MRNRKIPLTRQYAAALILLLFVSSLKAEVIFSRRVYKEHGSSFQQIWTWNPLDDSLRQLTHSPRDHFAPVCSGRTIEFTSPSSDVTDHVKLWRWNPATDKERIVGPAPEPREEPHLQAHGCDRFAKVGDLEACGNEELLVVSRSGKQMGRFQIQVNTCPVDKNSTTGKCETPIRFLVWTANGKWLLVGEQGLNDGSGQRQDDFYLVNAATMRIIPVASAFTAFWLPGHDRIVYVTPQELMSLPGGSRKRSVWVQQLMFFDPLKGAPTSITSGLSNNVDPSQGCSPSNLARQRITR